MEKLNDTSFSMCYLCLTTFSKKERQIDTNLNAALLCHQIPFTSVPCKLNFKIRTYNNIKISKYNLKEKSANAKLNIY